MQLTEIKNDLATINYNPEINRLVISDFILIEDANQSILSQIISIEATNDNDVNSAMLKFLLSIDRDANLTQYSGYVPAKNASLILINPQEVMQLIKGSEKNIFMGNLASYPNIPVELNIDLLRKKTYIQVDFIENKLQIIDTIVRGLKKHNKKTLLFDFLGLYNDLQLYTIKLGYNFKLPLNYEALCFIADEELGEFNNENRAILQGILIEVQNYVKETEDGFIPFDTLISVLDAQYQENNIPELLLLKNKLTKYQQLKIFAQNKSEFDFIDKFLKDNRNVKFDLSELPIKWHKIAFLTIFNIIKTKCYVITEFTDDNSNKNVIKTLYEKNQLRPIIISSYDYKYQLQLKSMSKNMILFKPLQKVNDFAGYTSFLHILSQDNYILWGEQTLFIPLILKMPSFVKKFDSLASKDISNFNKEDEALQDEEVITKVEDIENSNYEGNISEDSNLEKDNSEIENFEVPVEEEVTYTKGNEQIIEEPADIPNEDDIDFFFEESPKEETVIENIIEPSQEASVDVTEDIIHSNQDENEQVLQIDDSIESEQDAPIDNLEDVVLDSNLNAINDNSEVLSYEDEIIEESKEVVEPDIVENNEENEIAPMSEEESLEEISEDNTKNDTEDDQNEVIKIPEHKIEVKSPSIPVYKSEVAPQFDAKFAQGTYVHHPKYGRGVVEKIINYGSKQLCLIIFDNDGRKLLDPNIADLKQI